MKKNNYRSFAVIALTFLASLSFQPAKAQQPYSYYLDYHTEWYIHEFVWSFTNYSQDYYFTRYLDGDTVINGMPYFKEYVARRDSIYYFISQNTMIVTYPVTLAGFMREDSTKKIYYRDISASQDSLMYDFNLNVGDTFANEACTVQSIDTIYLGTSPRKRFLHIFSLIEGIGNTEVSTCHIPFESSKTLVCYQHHGDWLYFDSAYYCSDFPQPAYQFPTGYQDVFSADIKIYPTITKDWLYFESDLSWISHYAIYNSLGQIVINSKFRTEMRALNVENLPGGIYYLRLSTVNQQVITKKFIRQ